MPLMLPGGVYFALESMAWTGGMAFYDSELPSEAAFRAYLLTVQQFADIAAQEMYREPGAELEVVDQVVEQGKVKLGDGRYETLVYAGAHDGYPALTFTAPWRSTEVELNPPAPAYLAYLAGGLHESHGWDAYTITTYLAGRPGVEGRWPLEGLADVVGSALGSSRT